MKRTIILAIITALCPLSMMAQLKMNSTFNKKDTVLNVSLENISFNDIGLFCEYGVEEGSSLEISFLDSKGNTITKSMFSFILNEKVKRLIRIKPKQNLDFRFGFTYVKQHYSLKNLKKIRVKIFLKYIVDNDKGYGKDFIKEFSLE